MKQEWRTTADMAGQGWEYSSYSDVLARVISGLGTIGNPGVLHLVLLPWRSLNKPGLLCPYKTPRLSTVHIWLKLQVWRHLCSRRGEQATIGAAASLLPSVFLDCCTPLVAQRSPLSASCVICGIMKLLVSSAAIISTLG